MVRKRWSYKELIQKLIANYLFAIIGSAALALIIRFFIVEAFIIPTDFMSPTLIAGDYIFVTKVGLKTVGRGDVIIFAFPNEPAREYIKRVIAIEGDDIEIRDGYVWLNGKNINLQVKPDLVEEKVFRSLSTEETRYHVTWAGAVAEIRNMLSVKVPAGHVFVLGDNRAKGQDSRTWGFLPIKSITGQAWLIWFSIESPGFNVRWHRLFKKVNG